MSREVVGIDSGANRLAVYFTSQQRFDWYETKEENLRDQLRDLEFWLEHVAGVRYAEHDVFLEKVVIPHGGHGNLDTFVRHGMTVGMVVATVGGEIITPATWKAHILGHGHADKDHTREWVLASSPAVAEAIWDLSPTRKDRRADLYDAYCIGLHGDLARRRDLGLDEPVSVPGRARRSRKR
jgi:hypothetical protein